MKRVGLTRWNARLFHNTQLIWQQLNLTNLLHYEGEPYVLSAAFHTSLEGYGAAPKELYIGIDSRPLLHYGDTLKDVVNFEPTLETYQRIGVRTDKDFFTIRTRAVFKAIGGDLGEMRNYFLTTAREGTDGQLIVSSPLRHPFPFYEGYKLGVEMIVTMREAELADEPIEEF
jgi:hypothetical protein